MKIIVGNWKMNGTTPELKTMVDAIQSVGTKNKVIICVPFTMLNTGSANVLIGAQDLSTHETGAFTGEVSAKMISETGAKYVIVGHSERRQYHNETNEMIKQKSTMAISNGLTPIICIGETAMEKKSGKTMEIIKSALRECIPDNSNSDIMIAYEPRWAIGTGITPTVTDITTVHEFIADILSGRGLSKTPILYGGGVTGNNAHEIMSIPNVNGVLVGGASLKSDDFIPIIESV